MTITEIENAVKEGKSVHWKTNDYKVIQSGLNDGKFLIGWNIGGPNENYVGLLWEYQGMPYYKPSDFYIGE